MRSFPVEVVLVLAMLDLTTCINNEVYFTKDPWKADVNTITNNTCCYGNTVGFAPEIYGISPQTDEVFYSVESLRYELGVNCSCLDNNNCCTCSIFASIQNDGFVLKCGLRLDHTDMGRTEMVMLVVSNSSGGQVSFTTESPSDTYSNDNLKRVVTPVLIPVVLCGLFILAFVIIVIAIVLYKVCKNRQQRGSQQTSQHSSQTNSETSESMLSYEAMPYWESSVCDSEVISDTVQKLGATAPSLLKASDSALVQRRPHDTPHTDNSHQLQ